MTGLRVVKDRRDEPSGPTDVITAIAVIRVVEAAGIVAQRFYAAVRSSAGTLDLHVYGGDGPRPITLVAAHVIGWRAP